MGSPILPTEGPLGSPMQASPTSTVAGGGASFPSALQASRNALAGEANPGTLPPELLEEIAAAARTNEQLSASGRHVHFVQDEQSGRVTVELWGHEGNMLRTLSIAETLNLAVGKSLE